MNRILLSIALVSISIAGFAQDETQSTESVLPNYSIFSTTRVINNHSVETLKKGSFDFRITHRFGDINGDAGGYHQFWGLDQSADIRIAGEYGVTNKFMVGLGRSKGVARSGLIDGFLKYKLIDPTSSLPLAVTLLGSTQLATMPASVDSTSDTYFPEVAHRLSYTTQAIVGYKVSDRFSAQFVASYNHRNWVAFGDVNGIIAFGGGLRYKMTKVMALCIDYTSTQLADRNTGLDYKDAIGIGLEMDLGGHVFQVEIVNSRGIGENQFIPDTVSDISEGQYRLGFTISRPFKI